MFSLSVRRYCMFSSGTSASSVCARAPENPIFSLSTPDASRAARANRIIDESDSHYHRRFLKARGKLSKGKRRIIMIIIIINEGVRARPFVIQTSQIYLER